MRLLLLSLLLGALTVIGTLPREDIVIADFEGKDYGGWQVTGNAFGPGPAQGALPNQMPVSGYLGHGLVNSYFQGDASTGTLTSPEITLNRKYLNFLIGGGNHPKETCINLLVDGKVVRTATGRDSEQLDWDSWDLGKLEGSRARIEIVDRATGGWGHINVDQIELSDTRKAPVIMTDVLYDETYRPQFHFTSKQNWLNDPNGLMYYAGEYHLFFQHNPVATVWGNMTWGHAVSKDLVHWTQLEDAIKPDTLGTIFSGSAVVDWENTTGFGTAQEPPLVAIYTAAGDTSPESKGQPFTQCLAYSTDRGRTWTKYDANPVLPHIIGGNRDPKATWHAPTHQWILALYLDGNDYGLFASPDMKHWRQLQKLTLPGCSECPDFFEIKVEGEKAYKWVFTAANGHYVVGDFDGTAFKPEGGPLTADYGANYYAVQSYSDIPASDGRRIQIAWMNGGNYPEMPFNQQMSFPCILTLHRTPEGLHLYRWPAQEIHSLYGPAHTWHKLILHPDENPLQALKGDLFDIQADFEVGESTALGFRVRGQEVRYDVKQKTVTAVGKTAPLETENGHIRLRLLVDRTSLEVFGNDGKLSMTSCMLPSPDDHSLSVFAEGGAVTLSSLQVHPLHSAWKSH